MNLSWFLPDTYQPAPAIDFDAPAIPGLVSVVVPAYNAKRFIKRCIDSVWQQTLPHDTMELIVVDDGSSDGTFTRAAALARRSPFPMRVLQHHDGANHGVAATRNLGFSRARGEFIALLDVDDRYLPERLSRSVAWLTEHPADLCLCAFGRNVDERGRPQVGYNGSEIAGAYDHLEAAFVPPFTFEQLWTLYPVANSTVTLRRTALEEVGGYPHVMAHQAEDWYLMLCLSLVRPVPCLEEILIEYTNHEASYTHVYAERDFQAGARIEVFYHLVQWMVRRPEFKQTALDLYRKELPNVLAPISPLLSPPPPPPPPEPTLMQRIVRRLWPRPPPRHAPTENE